MSKMPQVEAGERGGDSDLSRTYAMVVVVEVLVILALYWLSRHFG